MSPLSCLLPRFGALLAATLACLAVWGPQQAKADQTIGVSASSNPSIDGASTTIAITGMSDTGGTVFVSQDSAGTTCATNPSADDGTMLISGDDVAGSQYLDNTTITAVAGNYVLCAWLMPTGDDGSGTPLAGPASAPFAVQPLQSTISLSAPLRVPYQQPIPVTVSWSADTAGSLLVQILPASDGPCTADPADEPQYLGWLSGQDGYTNSDTIGQSSSSGTSRHAADEFASGSYQVCAWAEEVSGSVVAGPVSVDVQMQALPGSRTYSGRSSQHLPVAVTLDGYAVQDIVYSARFQCGISEYFANGTRWNGIWEDSVLTAANFGTLSIMNAGFQATLDANPANRVHISGALVRGRLSGSLDVTMRVGPPQFKRFAVCRSGRVRFTITSALRRRRKSRPAPDLRPPVRTQYQSADQPTVNRVSRWFGLWQPARRADGERLRSLSSTSSTTVLASPAAGRSASSSARMRASRHRGCRGRPSHHRGEGGTLPGLQGVRKEGAPRSHHQRQAGAAARRLPPLPASTRVRPSAWR